MKDLIWIGNSLDVLRSFPEKVKDEMGFALHSIQMGSSPQNSKPFKGFPGVFEIVADIQGNTYRAVYALKIGKHVYVLHTFQKKSKSGIKTPQREIDLIRQGLWRPKEWKRIMAERIKSKKGSGNVFADLQLDQPEQRFLKATLAVRLLEILDKSELTQIQAAAQLGIRQPDISRLKSGDLSHYSVERLFGFFNSLDQRVEIRITPAKGRRGAETVIS